MIELRNSLRDADVKIKQLKREKKDLEVQQFRRERKIVDTIENPDNMKSVNDAQKELEVITEKVSIDKSPIVKPFKIKEGEAD